MPTITKLYVLLSEQVGKDTVENLTTFIEAKIFDEVSSATSEIASKDFVRSEIASAKTDMINWFVGLFITLALMIVGLYFKK
ncbi:MAG: hypothetical protein QM610_15125 [Chitinophagaceae bacterium]